MSKEKYSKGQEDHLSDEMRRVKKILRVEILMDDILDQVECLEACFSGSLALRCRKNLARLRWKIKKYDLGEIELDFDLCTINKCEKRLNKLMSINESTFEDTWTAKECFKTFNDPDFLPRLTAIEAFEKQYDGSR